MSSALLRIVCTTLVRFVATPWSAQRSPKRTLDSSGDSKRAPCEPRRPQESQGDFRRAQESPRSRQESAEGRREIRLSSGGLHPTPAYSRGHLGKPYPRKPRRAYRNTSRVLGGPRSAQGVEQAMDDVRKAMAALDKQGLVHPARVPRVHPKRS